MESSIRDIFFLGNLKLSWGLENDSTLFKKREHLLIYQNLKNDNIYTLQKLVTWSYIPNIDRGPYEKVSFDGESCFGVPSQQLGDAI